MIQLPLMQTRRVFVQATLACGFGCLLSGPATGAAHDSEPTPQAETREEECTPGYSPCIPPGPDVDCAGGSGNGPRYVRGPIRVTGSDPYGLDRDGDGVGCE
jgi:hypothetical protein